MPKGDDGLYQSARDRLRMHLPRKDETSQPRMCEPVQPSINRADAKSFSQQSDVNRTSGDPNRRSQGDTMKQSVVSCLQLMVPMAC